jgi:hypothetical protein
MRPIVTSAGRGRGMGYKGAVRRGGPARGARKQPMSDENQIYLPDSFLNLYRDARQRLTAPLAEVRARYELCEDLAQQLEEHARSRSIHAHGSEVDLLLRYHAGLVDPDSGFSRAEAVWVITRLSELLGWECPALPGEDAGEG